MVANGQRDIFEEILREKSVAFILVHNHPSEDVVPSDADIKMSKTH